jgi:hypothetical protein
MNDEDNDTNSASLGEAVEWGERAEQLKEAQAEINAIIQREQIDPEDQDDLAEAYILERYPELRAPTDLQYEIMGEPQTRTVQSIIDETRQRRVVRAQQTLQNPETDVFDKSDNGALLDYFNQKFGR